MAEVERPEGFEGLRVGNFEVVCGAVEVGKVKAEPPDPPIRKVYEFFGRCPEHGAAAKDRGEVLKGEAGIEVAVQEPVELFTGGGPPAGFVPAGMDDDGLRAEGICGIGGPAHGLLDMRPDLGERPTAVGCRSAGVHPVAVVGRVNDRRDGDRGDYLDIPAECLSWYDPDLDMVDVPAGVEGCKPGEESGVCCSPRCGRGAAHSPVWSSQRRAKTRTCRG